MHEYTLNALRQHYDLLPLGLPEMHSGVERVFLKTLFTEEETRSAVARGGASSGVRSFPAVVHHETTVQPLLAMLLRRH
ncbi:hypothetical protein ACFLWX_03310 [Chloroflexota bacterium]